MRGKFRLFPENKQARSDFFNLIFLLHLSDEAGNLGGGNGFALGFVVDAEEPYFLTIHSTPPPQVFPSVCLAPSISPREALGGYHPAPLPC